MIKVALLLVTSLILIPSPSKCDEITVDALLKDGSLGWETNGVHSANLDVKAAKGDTIIFRQVDTKAKHGFEPQDDAPLFQARGESDKDKPNAILQELGTGASAFGHVLPNLKAGDPPKEMLRLKVIRDISAPVAFECAQHKSAMQGRIVAK